MATAPGLPEIVRNWLTREEFRPEGHLLFAYFWSGASFAALLLAIAGGAGVDRFGPRRMLQVGLALLGLGFLISSQARFPGARYVALVALNLAMAIGIWLPVYTLPNNWFQRRKATAIAAVLLGSSVARLLASPVDSKLVALGWADVEVVVAGLVAWAVIGPVSVFVRNSPIERGAVGDRVEEPISSESVTRNPQLLASPQPDFTWWEAIRSRNYWLITGGQALFGSAAYSLYTVQLQLAAQRGLTISSGGLADGAGTAATAVAILVGGLVGDRIPIRFATAGFLAVQLAGGGVFLLSESPAMLLVGAAVMGFGGGALLPLSIAIRGFYFGRRNFATVTAISVLLLTLLSRPAPGTALALWAYSASANLPLLLAAIIATGVFGCVLLILAGPPKPSPSQRAATTAVSD